MVAPQPTKAMDPICVICDEIEIDSSDLQNVNAILPTEVTVEGSIIEVSTEIALPAFSPEI